MNKAQLVEAVAEQLGGRRAAAEAVDAVLDTIVRATVAGDRVSVTGFGTFERVDRAARYARNPQTGERVRVKKTSVPRFRPGQGFKDLVSGVKKLPKTGPSVKKAPKGSITPGKTGATAAARRAAAKRAAVPPQAAEVAEAAEPVPARKAAPAKRAPAKKAVPARKAAPAKKAPAKKAVPARKAAEQPPAPVEEQPAKKAAKKAPGRKAAAKRAAGGGPAGGRAVRKG